MSISTNRVVAALVVTWLLVLTGTGAHPTTVRAAQAGGQSLALFAAIAPVFTSPRCLGCHGRVDPSKGTNHEAGAVDVALDASGDMAKDTKEAKACLECHTAANQWRTAPHQLSFVGLDMLRLCTKIKRDNDLSAKNLAAQRAFLAHLSTDYFVGLAFVGRRAVGSDSPFGPLVPQPPPLSRTQFVAAARRWLQEGRASCGRLWNGTIEKYTSWDVPENITQGGTVKRAAHRSLIVHVDVVDGVGTAFFSYSSRDETSDPRWPAQGGCRMERVAEKAETESGKSIPASVQIALTPDGGSLVFSVGGIDGVRTQTLRVFPACRETPVDAPYKQGGTGGGASGPIDPKEPSLFNGERHIDEVDGGKTDIKWDLALSDD